VWLRGGALGREALRIEIGSGLPLVERHTVSDAWALDTYVACDIRCTYCITSAQGRSTPRVAPELAAERLGEELDAIGDNGRLGVGTSCDAYPGPECELGVTRRALEVLAATDAGDPVDPRGDRRGAPARTRRSGHPPAGDTLAPAAVPRPGDPRPRADTGPDQRRVPPRVRERRAPPLGPLVARRPSTEARRTSSTAWAASSAPTGRLRHRPPTPAPDRFGCAGRDEDRSPTIPGVAATVVAS
jgi:hypothetical protein